QRDWMDFLWDTERNYWLEMRDYLRNELGVKALIIGTQTTFSPAAIQAELDVVDGHSYWQHPACPTGWSTTNWYVHNKPMAGNTYGNSISALAPTRVAGKPFVCTEFNHPAPLTYASEMMPLTAAYAALQDWDGIFAFDFLCETNLYPVQFNEFFFDFGFSPGKLVTFPVAAAMFCRGDVTAASNRSFATVTPEAAIANVGQAGVMLGASDFGVEEQSALQQQIALATGSVVQVQKTLYDTTRKAVTSDTEQLTWDMKEGLVLLRAPCAKAVVGHAKERTFDLGDGVIVTPGETMQGTNWVAVTLLMRDGESFSSWPGRALITAVGYTDNHRMQWKSGMGPLDTTSSVGTNWGCTPMLIEGVPATITLPVPVGQVVVWALDNRGNRCIRIPVSGDESQTTFSIGREYKTAWYEVTSDYPALLAQKLLAYWRFDESVGTVAVDASAHGYHAALNGGTWCSGHVNGGVELDGIAQYAVLPESLGGRISNFTWAGWVNWESGREREPVFDCNDGTDATTTTGSYMVFRLRSAAAPQFALSPSGSINEQRVEGLDVFPTSVWVHVAVTLDGETLTLYRDGKMENSGPVTLSPADLGLVRLCLGKSAYSEDPHFSGKMDEVRFYNRGLSAAEVHELAAGHFDEPDTDGDGIEDAWERLHFGAVSNCLPFADADGDGADNYREFLADTIPTNALSGLRITGEMELPSVFSVRFDSSEARRYRLVAATNLVPPVGWEPVGESTPGVNGPLSLQADDSGVVRYYRVRAQQP
ncbi:MAG: LamG domain-containing protein, partial [Kiritimatiellae bacterium]|nr:LamG domain-containing protein [Kiritimatiellia bacterium]